MRQVLYWHPIYGRLVALPASLAVSTVAYLVITSVPKYRATVTVTEPYTVTVTVTATTVTPALVPEKE